MTTCLRLRRSRAGASAPLADEPECVARRSRQGTWALEPADYDLPGLIENVNRILVRERASRRGITLGRTIDELLGVVHGDERKVKQILLNLLSNAPKFTPEAGRIDINGQLDGEIAEVSLADTGVGIAPADQEAVFEEFRQVGAAERARLPAKALPRAARTRRVYVEPSAPEIRRT